VRVRRPAGVGRQRVTGGTPHQIACRRYCALWRLRKYPAAKETLNLLKLVSGCKLCGYHKSPAGLHFHHRTPHAKRYSITYSQIWRKDFAEELSKCEVLCANCHAETHLRQEEEYP
jgi:hypothetical protein